MWRYRVIKQQLEWIRRNIYVAILICHDPRVPQYAKVIAAFCVGYVFSPVQLIPSFIPLVGWVDDAVVVAVGMSLLIKLTPKSVLSECHERASTRFDERAEKWKPESAMPQEPDSARLVVEETRWCRPMRRCLPIWKPCLSPKGIP
jgi:uncharacterized membrane protein YkvA (DUF1232 family)